MGACAGVVAAPAIGARGFGLFALGMVLARLLGFAAGLPRPRLYVIPDPSPNALAAGRDPAHAVLAVTAGALALLDREETQGVVAHELAHIGNRDTAVMTLVSVLFGGLLGDQSQSRVELVRVGEVALLDQLPPQRRPAAISAPTSAGSSLQKPRRA